MLPLVGLLKFDMLLFDNLEQEYKHDTSYAQLHLALVQPFVLRCSDFHKQKYLRHGAAKL